MKHKNSVNGQRGFTIIETTLFLAISAALVLVAILGTGSVIRSVRFTDSMRSTQAFVQSEYAEILNGVNPRDAAAICGASSAVEPGKSDCLLLGKLVHFPVGEDTLNSYYVVSEVPPLNDSDYANLSDTKLIQKVNPEVVKNVGEGTFNVPWGAIISDSKRLSDGKQVNAYMVLRSPQSSRLVSYTFSIPNSIPRDLSDYVDPSKSNNIGQKTNFCIARVDGGGQQAALQVAGGQGDSAVDVIFDGLDFQDCDGSGGVA